MFDLKSAEQVRVAQTAKMQKKIKQMYEDMAKDIRKRIKQMKGSSVQKIQLILLERDMGNRAKEVSKELTDGITDAMITTANKVVEDTRKFLQKLGYSAKDASKAFMYIPDDVVRNIVNGQIYQTGWTLSKAIWGHTKDFNDKLSEIIGRGVAHGKSTLEIAKDLEKYVSPTEAKASRIIRSYIYKKDVNGNWIYEKDEHGNIKYDKNGKPIRKKFAESYYPGKVDYNAQRLARTMVSHAYQQSFMAVNKNDPFVIGYRWLTSNFHGRVCSICEGYANDDSYEMGPGIFPKDALPLDHPNGMCTFEAVLSDDLDVITDRIADWYEAEPGTYPELDEFAKEFLY